MSDSKDLEIKHYRRATAGAREKELVSETVEEGSATFEFLQKLETSRLKRECVLMLDMRGKVPGVCQPYVHKDRVFYLDDASLAIFHAGMKENNGVFTVGAYEQIVFGDHTTRAIRQRAEAANPPRTSLATAPVAAVNAPTSGQAKGLAGEAAKAPAVPAEALQPEIITYGYYHRRAEQRLEISTDVLIEISAIRYLAKTKDISRRGTQLVLPYVPGVTVGVPAFLTYTALQQQATTSLDRLAYVIVKCEEQGEQLILSLKRECDDLVDPVGSFLERFIEGNKKKYRINMEDEINSVVSLMYERIFAENTVSLPLFVCRKNDDALALSFAISTGNQCILSYFNNAQGISDLTFLSLPHRIKKYAELARQGGMQDVILVAFRHNKEPAGSVSTFCDFEVADSKAFRDMLRFALWQKSCCIYKIRLCAVQPLNSRKLELYLRPLYVESEQGETLLREKMGEVEVVLNMQEVTEATREGLLLADLANEEVTEKGLLEVIAANARDLGQSVWRGLSRYSLAGGEAQQVVESAQCVIPSPVIFGYLRRRSEERYVLQTEVEVEVNGKVLSAQSTDISRNGVGLMLAKVVPVQVGDVVLVTFTELQKMVSHIKLKKVRYVAMRIGATGSELGLVFDREEGNREIPGFFSDLIARNKNKLDKDLGDVLTEVTARIFESIYAENLMSIPFFLMKGGRTGLALEKIALNDRPDPLVDFFRKKQGNGFDFNPISDAKRVGRIAVQLRTKSNASGDAKPDELILLMEQARSPTGTECVNVMAMHELQGSPRKQSLVQRILATPQHRVVKYVYWPLRHLNEVELDSMVEPISQHSRHKAQMIRDDIKRIVGLGEVVDITNILRLGEAPA